MKTQVVCDGTIVRHRIDCTIPQHVTVLSPSGEIMFVPLEIHRDHVIMESCTCTLGQADKAIPAGAYNVVIVEGFDH